MKEKYRVHELVKYDYSEIGEYIDENHTDRPLRNDEIVKLLNEKEELYNENMELIKENKELRDFQYWVFKSMNDVMERNGEFDDQKTI